MQEKSNILQYHDWQTEALQDTLIVGYLNNSLDYIQAQIKWYRQKRTVKRYISTGILVLAVLGFALSILFPLVPGLKIAALSASDFGWYAAGYICLVFSSLILLSDRLFGHTDGWMRYTMAEIQIERTLSEYHGQWLILLSKIDVTNLNQEQRAQLIDIISKLDMSVKDIIKSETSNWRELLTTNLQDFQTKTDARVQTSRVELLEVKAKIQEK